MSEINILVMTHGNAGKALVESGAMIIGDSKNIFSLALEVGMSADKLVESAKGILEQVRGKTLILTDLYGGTPSNVAMMLSNFYDVHCISGVNLPMLIETIMARDSNSDMSLYQLAECTCKTGKESCRIFGFKQGEDA